ncbi:hypothetical protein ACLBYN_16210, partial [Pseudomonas aeruginosa]
APERSAFLAACCLPPASAAPCGGMPANPENARKASRELFAIRLKATEHKGCGASEGLRFL